jgi:hypothetical protein
MKQTRSYFSIPHTCFSFVCSGSFGSFLPSEGAHFCRENGKQLTFNTRGAEQAKHTSHSSTHGYRTILLKTDDLDDCLGFCCKLRWCKHASLEQDKCYGMSCSGDQCSVSKSLVTRVKNKDRKISGKSRNNRDKEINGKEANSLHTLFYLNKYVSLRGIGSAQIFV